MAGRPLLAQNYSRLLSLGGWHFPPAIEKSQRSFSPLSASAPAIQSSFHRTRQTGRLKGSVSYSVAISRYRQEKSVPVFF
ncbi:hypothetical protein ACCT20_37150, partial [Rhizobium ruizarguesonis]